MGHFKNRGQGLVEFALVLPVLVLILLGIAEGAHVIQAYIAAQNAVKDAARYAVSGKPLNATGDPWTLPPEQRVNYIEQVAIKSSAGTAYTRVITDVTQYDTFLDRSTCDATCAGVLGIRVDWIEYDVDGNERVVQANHPGIEGSDVKISLYNNVALFDPIYAAMVPNGYLTIQASMVMRNEGGKPITGAPPPFEEGTGGSPGSGSGGPNTSPLIEIQDGQSHPAGETIYIRIRQHDTNTTYNIYVDNLLVGPISTDAQGNGIIAYTIPLNKPVGTYTVESRALDGTQIASTFLTVTQPILPAIITNEDILPFGSVLTYSLVSHAPLTTYNIDLQRNGSTVDNLNSLSTDANGISAFPAAYESYTIPNNGSLAEGTYILRSTVTNTTAATHTLTLREGCIKINQGDCGESVTVPNGIYLNILVQKHSPYRDYIIKLHNTDTGANTIIQPAQSTDAIGNIYLVYALSDTLPDGNYVIQTEDAQYPGAVIAQTPVVVSTPPTPFIAVVGGYSWPAGSTIEFQLRNHDPNTQYDIFWEDQLIIADAPATDANGFLSLRYTIPYSTPQGFDYTLQSKPHSTNPVPGNYTAQSPDIEVIPNPYLRIAQGNTQVPGAPVTVELHNHNINNQYYVYVEEEGSTSPGRALPYNPVTTDGVGNGSIRYDIPSNLSPGSVVTVTSYLASQSPITPTAQTVIQLLAADLQVLNIETPPIPTFNADMPITVTIVNAAPVTITHRSFDVDLYLDPPTTPDLGRSLPPGDRKIWLQPPLAYSETRTFTTTLAVYGAYDHNLWVRADTSNRIPEGQDCDTNPSSNECNNLASTTISPPTCMLEYDGSDLTGLQAYGDTDLSQPDPVPDKLQLISTGSSTWGTDDDASNRGLFYAYRTINFNGSTDFEVLARLSTTDPNAQKWGIELRESTAGDSAKIDWGYYRSGGGVQYRSRRPNGNRTGTTVGNTPHPSTTPLWLRVQRVGNTVTLYYSTQDTSTPPTTWTTGQQITNNPIINGNQTLVGLFSASYTSNSPQTFEALDFRICAPDCTNPTSVLYAPHFDGVVDAGWNTHAFGNAATPTPSFSEIQAGTPVYTPFSYDPATTLITMNNNGSNAVDANSDDDGGYLYAYHTVSGNFDVMVRAVSQSDYEDNTTPPNYAMFGLELRADLDPTADKLLWSSTHNNRLYRMERTNGSRRTGSYSNHPRPIWLRIVRHGAEFTLYYSTDTTAPPTNWVEQATRTLNNMPDTLYVGVINDSHNSTKKNTVTFDNYHVCVAPSGAESCGAVRESNGLVVIDAINQTANNPGAAASWIATIRDGKSGYYVPNGNPDYYSFSTDAPELQYQIDVTNPGTYYVWVLGYAASGNDDSVFVALTGSTPSRNLTFNTYGSLSWSNDLQNTSARASIDFSTAGRQTISVWQREDGFEFYQIILTSDPNFTPNANTDYTPSQCSAAGIPDPPPGLLSCQTAIQNGDFEDDNLMSLWHYAGISEQVTRTSVPHYFGVGQSFSMLLPATEIAGLPRHPWIYQEFDMPGWVITPTINGGTSLNLTLHTAVNPEGVDDPDPLFVSLQDQTGNTLAEFTPITITTGATPPFIDPNNPDPNNSEWVQHAINVADGFSPAGSLLNYRNQRLRLYLNSPNPNNNASTRFYIDNVDLQVCTQQPVPSQYSTKVSGDVRVFINGEPTEKPGVNVWIYAIDGSMAKTYTIQDSTFSFYDLPADSGGTQYILYAEYWEDSTFYSASTVIVLQPGQTISNISLLLF